MHYYSSQKYAAADATTLAKVSARYMLQVGINQDTYQTKRNAGTCGP